MTRSIGEQMVRANGVDLCAQTFGDPADPAILLIAGAAGSMLGWEDEFCERLAAGSRFVIRYDHRDTGRSVSYAPGAPPYTFRDLAEDSVGLLDALSLGGAHFVGLSMGGGIAQLVALEHPDRVASLMLLATSPFAPRPDGPELPSMSEAFLAYASGAQSPDWTDRAAVIDFIVAAMRMMSGESPDFDDAAARDFAGRDVDRTVNVASNQLNHFAIDGGDPILGHVGEIRAPTLVIHGARDPVFPPGHGVALAQEIPGARLLALDEMGHELPRAVWDTVISAILRHTSGGGGDGVTRSHH
ncbi:MAG: alpha/beta fold hydrolase [Thermomicrobiales bacterium]